MGADSLQSAGDPQEPRMQTPSAGAGPTYTHSPLLVPASLAVVMEGRGEPRGTFRAPEGGGCKAGHSRLAASTVRDLHPARTVKVSAHTQDTVGCSQTPHGCTKADGKGPGSCGGRGGARGEAGRSVGACVGAGLRGLAAQASENKAEGNVVRLLLRLEVHYVPLCSFPHTAHFSERGRVGEMGAGGCTWRPTTLTLGVFPAGSGQ